MAANIGAGTLFSSIAAGTTFQLREVRRLCFAMRVAIEGQATFPAPWEVAKHEFAVPE
jgi:hypothetical protein